MKRLFTLALALSLACAGVHAQHSLVKLDVNTVMGSYANQFTSFKDKVYFIADDGTHGAELWWTDGISYGMVADINTGPFNAFDPSPQMEQRMCVMDGMLYFPARDSSHGTEIWAYDGVNPPVMTGDLDTVYDTRTQLTTLNGWLYFWGATGVGGTLKLHRYHPVQKFQEIYGAVPATQRSEIAVMNGKIYFPQYGTGATGIELHVYNPADGTISMVEDIYPGSVSSIPASLYAYKNVLFFVARTPDYGIELHIYDGFSAPRRITDLVQGPGNSFTNVPNAERMIVYNNKLYFMANSSTTTNRRHLYAYHPQADMLELVKEMRCVDPGGMAVYGRKLYFGADTNGIKRGMYVYDGSTVQNLNQATGTNLPDGFIPEFLTESNGRLYFAAADDLPPFAGTEAYVYTDSVALGIQDVAVVKELSVYPNPATTEAHIAIELKTSTAMQLSVADMQGRVVYSSGTKQYAAGSHTLTIPVQGLAVGTYIYTLRGGDGAILGSGRLVKE